MSSTAADNSMLAVLEEKATRLRIDSIRATTAAGSGHPTSCASAAEIMSVLFFSVMRYDPANPRDRRNDKFVLSKGHAAPILYAAWAEAGAFPIEHLTTLRRLDSDLEGHPTPRLAFVEVATGSLGQGLSNGLGIAAAARLDRSGQRVFVLMGDGETAEGSVWEAAQIASAWKIDNLCATVDINRLGQSQPTLLQHDMEAHRRRWEAFGWQALVVDGHNIPALLGAYAKAARTSGQPTVVLARTIKGKGMLEVEDKEGWHGKAMKPDVAARMIGALEQHLPSTALAWQPRLPAKTAPPDGSSRAIASPQPPPYVPGEKEVATRRAFGDALATLGKDDSRIVVLDGDVKNSTYTEGFLKACPDRFFECFIAEQNMVGAAAGLAANGKIPFASTFACFFTRPYDFVRMSAISGANIKLAGTHVGVSIGEDGPSQMGLEDLAMMCAEPNYTVLYPSDATAAWRATELALEHRGPCYLRLARMATPVFYNREERFSIGKCKVLRQSDRDRAVVVTGGVTLAEALTAYDQLRAEGLEVRIIDLFSIQPIDREALIQASRACHGLVITVEDHYSHGGLGDAVLGALAEEYAKVYKLAVREIPHSGKPSELLDRYGISARHIAETVRIVTKQTTGAGHQCLGKLERANASSERSFLMSSSGAGGAAEKDLYEQVIDVLNAIFGSHSGYRPVHSKGIICEGTFRASAEARVLTRAPHMQGSQIPCIVRFSDFSGDPGVRDNDPTASPRGMAIRFQLPGGTSTDILAQSYNGFPARDVPEFLAFLRALGSSGPGVEKPTPLDAFLADHPAAKLFAEAPKPTPQSFATESYYAVDTFQFVNRDGRRQPGRYRVVPIAGEHHLQPSEEANLPSNYLFDELRQRLQSNPVEFRLVVQLPAGADPIEDPTRLWPEDRQQKELGILTITKPSADSSSIERRLGFDPARLTDGIEPGDPLIEVRSAVYAIAVRRRGA